MNRARIGFVVNKNLAYELTQKACCSLSRWAKSSNGIVQLATKSSGGIAASWKTVNPMFFALVTSWMNDSFHVGSNVFDFVVERSASDYEMFEYFWGIINYVYFK